MKKTRLLPGLLFLCLIGILCGCSSGAKKTEVTEGEPHDSTPVVLVPTADGQDTIEEDGVILDISNKEKGYLMAMYQGDAEKINIQITGPNEVTYLYFLQEKNQYIAMPLSAGDGVYEVGVYEHIEDDMYSSVLEEEMEVKLENEFLPFLYANQFVNFDENTKAVSLAKELTQGCETTMDALSAIYNYVVDNLSYDYEKAETVQAMYLPDVDETLETKKGICFDYAALMCTMLRTQQIPTKLEIGYTGGVYHAWISTHIKGYGWVDGIIQFDGKSWKLMDPTFASAEDRSKDIMDHINNEENYEIMYER